MAVTAGSLIQATDGLSGMQSTARTRAAAACPSNNTRNSYNGADRSNNGSVTTGNSTYYDSKSYKCNGVDITHELF